MFNKALGAAGAVLVLSLTACGGASEQAASEVASEAAVRTVANAFGTTEVPSDPQKVIALDEYAAIEMLALGVKPTKVYGTLDSKVSAAVLEAAGVEVPSETAFLQSPNLEKVAAEAPDLIVMSNAGPLPEYAEQFGAIAPTIGLSFSEGWEKALTETAATFGKEAEAEKITARLEASIAEASVAKAESLSIVFGYGGTLNSPQPSTVMAQLVEQVGLSRPEAETSDTVTSSEALTTFSAEALEQHDADAMVLLADGYYDAGFVKSQKLYDKLGQVQDNRVFEVDGDTWFANNVFAVQWILDDLSAIFAGDGEVGEVADAQARWDEFVR